MLLFRLLWGFFGSETARFSRFLTSPRIAFQHCKYALLREPDRQVGHNPAGGWMVLFLLALLLAETLTGIYVANDIADVGPLTAIVPAADANAIEASHAILWDVLLAAIVLHVLAIFAMRQSRDKTCCADDHRDKGPAGNRARAAHRRVRLGQPSSLPAAPRLRPSSPSSCSSDQFLGGIT